MLKKVRIQNFKSIADETIELGRINVFIGENGCGKSNLLEAFAYLAGAMSNRLTVNDIELRGVRVARPDMTVSAFGKKIDTNFIIEMEMNEKILRVLFSIAKEENKKIYADWERKVKPINHSPNTLIPEHDEDVSSILEAKDDLPEIEDLAKRFANADVLAQLFNMFPENQRPPSPPSDSEEKKEIEDFIYKIYKNIINTKVKFYLKEQEFLENYLIYQFETASLRGMGFDDYVKPLGIQGEGLDVLFEQLEEQAKALILKKMSFIGWLADTEGVQSDKDGKLKRKGLQLGGGHSSLYFKDKYLYDKRNLLSAENANEGVLHLLACITAVVSSYTPRFFAIDNVDATLNPRLCRALTKTLADLVVEKDKQLLLTTQNPAILDGLDIYDEDQRLFAVSRDSEGKTRVRRIKIKEGVIFNENDPEGDVNGKKKTAKLSEMWMNGLLGAVPKFQM